MVFPHHLDVKFLLFLSTKKLLAPFTPGQKKQSESRRASRQLANSPPHTHSVPHRMLVTSSPLWLISCVPFSTLTLPCAHISDCACAAGLPRNPSAGFLLWHSAQSQPCHRQADTSVSPDVSNGMCCFAVFWVQIIFDQLSIGCVSKTLA